MRLAHNHCSKSQHSRAQHSTAPHSTAPTLRCGSCVKHLDVCDACLTSAERMLTAVDAGWRRTGLRGFSTGRADTRSTVDCSCRRHPLAKRAHAYARGIGSLFMVGPGCGQGGRGGGRKCQASWSGVLQQDGWLLMWFNVTHILLRYF